MKKRTMLGLSAVGFVAISASGCNDPVAPTGQGAVQVIVGPVAQADIGQGEKNCNTTNLPIKLGVVDVANRASVADGTDGVSVACRVTPSGAGFNVSASISRGDEAFSVDGYVETGMVTKGDVTISNNTTIYGGSVKCDIAIDRPTEDAQLAVGPGRVWARVSCAKLSVNGESPPPVCKATGVFVFENCNE
jgi:hypothetical protein